MKFNSIRFKISMLYLAIVTLILFGYSAYLYLGLRLTLFEDIDAELRIKAVEAEKAIQAFSHGAGTEEQLFTAVRSAIMFEEFPDPEELKGYQLDWLRKADRLGLKEDAIRFFSPSGDYVVGRMPRFPLGSGEIGRIEQGQRLFSSHDTDKRRGKDFRVISVPFFQDDREVYVLQVGSSIKPIVYLLKRRLLLILFSIPLLVAGTGLTGRVFVVQLMKPVSRVTDAARRITHENLDQRIPVEHSDVEMHRLVDSFNEMIERLGRSFAYIKEFSMQVAHELKTPLTIVRGETDLALRRERKGDEYRRVLTEVRAETDRMTGIINDLLLFTRLEYGGESFPLEPTDLTLVLEELHGHTALLARKRKISHNLELIDRPITVNAHPLHLRRLFLNLVANALKFTGQRGTVLIRAWKEEGKGLVSVRDTGAGIPEEDLPRIFEQFFHRDRQGLTGEPGTGLGLSIAQSIVQLHRGSIQVHSRENQGSVFTVSIPLADHPA